MFGSSPSPVSLTRAIRGVTIAFVVAFGLIVLFDKASGYERNVFATLSFLLAVALLTLGLAFYEKRRGRG